MYALKIVSTPCTIDLKYSQHVAYKDIFTYIEPWKYPTTLGHAPFLVHHSPKEDPFTELEEEVINYFLLYIGEFVPNKFLIK